VTLRSTQIFGCRRKFLCRVALVKLPLLMLVGITYLASPLPSVRATPPADLPFVTAQKQTLCSPAQMKSGCKRGWTCEEPGTGPDHCQCLQCRPPPGTTGGTCSGPNCFLGGPGQAQEK
jgi:hypothetical protein